MIVQPRREAAFIRRGQAVTAALFSSSASFCLRGFFSHVAVSAFSLAVCARDACPANLAVT